MQNPLQNQLKTHQSINVLAVVPDIHGWKWPQTCIESVRVTGSHEEGPFEISSPEIFFQDVSQGLNLPLGVLLTDKRVHSRRGQNLEVRLLLLLLAGRRCVATDDDIVLNVLHALLELGWASATIDAGHRVGAADTSRLSAR